MLCDRTQDTGRADSAVPNRAGCFAESGASRLFAAGVELLQAAEERRDRPNPRQIPVLPYRSSRLIAVSSSRSGEIEVLDEEPAEFASLIRGTRAGLARLHQLAAGWEDGE